MSLRIGDIDAVYDLLREPTIAFFARTQRRIGGLAPRNIRDDASPGADAVAPCCTHHLQRHGELATIRCAQYQLAAPGGGVVMSTLRFFQGVLGIALDESFERLADETRALDAEHRRNSEIRLDDDRVVIDRQIARRCQIVEISARSTRLFELVLHPTQLFVLQLELDFLNLERVR